MAKKEKTKDIKKEIIMELKDVSKTYIAKDRKVEALKKVNIEFSAGKFYAIMGHSGSGKSTLVNILGLIDNVDKGEYRLYENNIVNYSDLEISNIRMKNIGFIFQEFHLNLTLNAFENVIVPMVINKEIKRKERKKIALKLLDEVGLIDRATHFPRELSGGEQQRVAIARALANDPKIILADEPTGNLDEENERIIFTNLKKLSKQGKCVIVVSHTNEIKQYADVIFKLKNGIIIGEEK